MNLQIIRSGDLRPTSDSASVHTPFVWDFAGQPVRVILRPKETGRKPTATEAGSLASRTLAYCRSHELKPHVYYWGGRTRVYVPEQVAQLVHRTGWTAKNAVFAEAQGDLFREFGQ